MARAEAVAETQPGVSSLNYIARRDQAPARAVASAPVPPRQLPWASFLPHPFVMLLSRKIFLPLLLALGLGAPAAAQDSPPVMWEGYAGQRAMTDLLFNNTTGRVVADMKGAKGTKAAPAAKAAPATSATLPFRRDLAITRRAEALTVKQVKISNETAGEQLAQLFASKDVLAAWGQAMQPYGLGLNNVADAMTANWLVLYLVANELPDPPTAAQVAGLRQQVRRVCALPGIGGKLKTSAQRQQLADYLHLQSLLLNEAQSGAEKTHDAATSATLARHAREVARQNMGFDPTTVQLTDKGLVRR